MSKKWLNSIASRKYLQLNEKKLSLLSDKGLDKDSLLIWLNQQ